MRLGRLLQAEKGLRGWWGGREAAGVPFPPSSSLRPQSAQRSSRGGGRLRVWSGWERCKVRRDIYKEAFLGSISWQVFYYLSLSLSGVTSAILLG